MSEKSKQSKSSKGKNSKKNKSSKNNKSKSKSSKKNRAAERAAKREARKGDGTFPDILVVTREKSSNEGGKKWFLGHSEDLNTLYTNGQTVAVYKLRRVSTIDIKRKVTR
jgi:hypothetical protein